MSFSFGLVILAMAILDSPAFLVGLLKLKGGFIMPSDDSDRVFYNVLRTLAGTPLATLPPDVVCSLLNTAKRNTAPDRFYKSAGAKRIGDIRFSVMDDTVRMTGVEILKDGPRADAARYLLSIGWNAVAAYYANELTRAEKDLAEARKAGDSQASKDAAARVKAAKNGKDAAAQAATAAPSA